VLLLRFAQPALFFHMTDTVPCSAAFGVNDVVSWAPLAQISNEDCLYMIYRKEGSDEWESLEIGDPPPAPPEAA
jgi:hypothetical protein